MIEHWTKHCFPAVVPTRQIHQKRDSEELKYQNTSSVLIKRILSSLTYIVANGFFEQRFPSTAASL